MHATRERTEGSQREERVGDLEHEDVRVAVVVHDEDVLDGAAHPKVLVVVLQALESAGDLGCCGLCAMSASCHLCIVYGGK